MTNLDAPGYRLREDLHAAAQALIARRQRLARRRKRIVIGFATAVLLAGGGATAAALLSRATAPTPTTTVSTPAVSPSPPPVTVGPRANARAQMSAFASAPHAGQQPPEAVTHTLNAFIVNPGENIGKAVEPVQLLVSSSGAQLYAVATTRGYVCYALSEPASVGGSCAGNLRNDAPISATVSQAAPGGPTMVAGVASDAVASISAMTAQGGACGATVVNNGFVCTTSSATPGEIHGFAVRLRDGRLIQVPF